MINAKKAVALSVTEHCAMGVVRIHAYIDSLNICQDCAAKEFTSCRKKHTEWKLEQTEEVLQQSAEEQEKLRSSAGE